MCREIRVDRPYRGSETQYATTSYQSLGTPGAQHIRVATNPPHGASSEAWHETYLDGFGRSIVTRSSGPTADQPIRVARSYAARGQVESETAPYFEAENAYATVYRYDGLDRPIRRTHADGTAIATAYGLSASSFATVTVTDELGRTATLHSDAYGRKLREVRRLDGIDVATTYVFDLADNLTGIADPLGNAWRYSYDSLGRRTRADDPDLGAWTYAYDSKGRLVRQVDAKGQATSLTYDAHDRVTERRTLSADVVTSLVANRYDEARSGYHNAGFLTGATRSIGGATVAEIAYDQDEAGRLARQSWTIEGIIHTQSATYDAGGRVVERVYPDGTSSGTHGYNAAGWLDRLGLAITATRYDARGQAVGVEHGTGTRTVSTYDAARGWLVNRSTTMGAAQLQSLTYSRGPTGRIEAVTGASAAESWSYSYDTLDRLVRADNQGGDPLDEAYAYDLAGNMVSNSRVGAYAYPAQGPGSVRPHAPVRIGDETLTYDGNGNLVSFGAKGYTWDGENRLQSVNGSVFFAYGPDGERIAKRDASGTSVFLGDDVEVRGGLTTAYIHDEVRVEGGVATSLARDHLGSIRVETEGQGLSRSLAYGGYGEPQQATSGKGYIGDGQRRTLQWAALTSVGQHHHRAFAGRGAAPDAAARAVPDTGAQPLRHPRQAAQPHPLHQRSLQGGDRGNDG